MKKSIYANEYRQLIQKLRNARIKQQISQQQLAVKTGFSRYIISRIESASIRIDVYQYVVIARALGEDPGMLLGDHNEEEASDEDAPFLRIAGWQNGSKHQFSCARFCTSVVHDIAIA